MPLCGQYNSFTLRAFDQFFPVLESQLFCQLLLFSKYDYSANSILVNTFTLVLLLKQERRLQLPVNSLSKIKEYHQG